MKRCFFQAAAVLILLYGCSKWTLIKRMEKKIDGNYTRMMPVILTKFWRQHPTKKQLYGFLPPIIKTIKIRLTKHARHCWRRHDVQFEPTYSSSVPIRDVALRTCRNQWTIGKYGERESAISVLIALHNDDDDDDDAYKSFFSVVMQW